MRFARIVFIVAGIWGILVLTPLFFLIDVTGRHYAPPSMYPQFFYGFLSVAIAWQIAGCLGGVARPGAGHLFYRGIREESDVTSELIPCVLDVIEQRVDGRGTSFRVGTCPPDWA